MSNSSKTAFFRFEQAIIRYLPGSITPLRFRIITGYALVVLIGYFGWAHVTAAWRFAGALLAPIGAMMGAILALKLSLVITHLFTLTASFVKLFTGFLMVVLKPGIVKAIFVPQLVSLAKWAHKKSSTLQSWVNKIYLRAKEMSQRLLSWWKAQNTLDKALLFGFLVPLLLVVLVILVIERATGVFAIKKMVEQFVQFVTKFVIRHFHRLPLIGGIPTHINALAKRITEKQDREDLVNDLKNLGSEIYVAQPGNDLTDNNRTAHKD